MQRCGYCDRQCDIDHSEDEKEDHGSAQPAPPTKSRFHRLPPISTSRPLSRCHLRLTPISVTCSGVCLFLVVIVDEALLPIAWAARLSLNPAQRAGVTSLVAAMPAVMGEGLKPLTMR